MTGIAHSETLERVDESLLQCVPDMSATYTRHWEVVTAVGRVAAVSGPVLLVTLLSGRRPTVAAIVIIVLLWLLLLRAARNALPHAAGLGATGGSVAGTALGLGATLLVVAVFPDVGLTPGQLVFMTLGILSCSVTFERWLAQLKPPPRVLVVGAAGGGDELARILSNGASSDYSFVGLLTDDLRCDGVDDASGELEAIVLERSPDLVVLTESARNEALDRLLHMSVPSFRILSLDHFYEHAFGRVPVRNLSPAWFMSLLHLNQRPYRRTTKRAFDLVVGGVGSILAGPVIALIAVLVRCSGPGPVIYRQVRLGEGGRPFEMLKFRTMVDGAEKSAGPAWATEDDPRITRVGRALRRVRLDELPQLWNVLRGEMSFVGPRPERPELVQVLERDIPFWTRRHLVKPGMTGWAQVCRGYTADVHGAVDKLSYDLYYLKHRRLLLDLAIALRTAGIVARGDGGPSTGRNDDATAPAEPESPERDDAGRRLRTGTKRATLLRPAGGSRRSRGERARRSGSR